MMSKTIASGLGFAESPRWHDNKLWFVDYFSGLVLCGGLDGDFKQVANVPGTPGGLGFLPDGTPLVVSQREFKIYAIGEQGALTEYADLSDHAIGAANELLVDPQGRAYVGHHGFDFFGNAEPRPSSLLLVTQDGKVDVAADGVIFPNGMALLDAGRTLILAESFANRLTAFDVAADGSLSRGREWAQLGHHTPDGICADASGAVWAASPLTSTFLRVREGGAIVDEVKTDHERWAVACAFVGEKLDTLCCITAATTLEDMPQGKSEAFIDLIMTNTPGALN